MLIYNLNEYGILENQDYYKVSNPSQVDFFNNKIHEVNTSL
jgi:hypothetical protein